MSSREGELALALLERRKRAGFWRRQWRKLRTPKGAALALLGAAVITLWLFSVLLGTGQGPEVLQVERLALFARGGLLTMTALTVSSAFSMRGLYLQASEIESLFSAPISRAELIRYRLRSALVRSLLGGALFGWMFSRRAPQPLYAFAGLSSALLTLPLLGQGLSLVLGDAENRLSAKLAKLPWRWISFAFVAAALTVAVQGGFFELDAQAEFDGHDELFAFLARQPFVVALGLPFTPWVACMTSLDAASFWPPFLFCAAIFAALWLAVPRIGVDFRELSLETSADVARRLARARRGLAANSGAASERTRTWRTPWLAGRGPFGAIAWRKAVTIVRKSRASFVLGGLIVTGVVGFSIVAVDPDADAALRGSLIVAGFGTFYLCLGLRFDFREDLELVGLLRSWPVAPWKLFLATLLPETALVSAMIALGVVVLALYHGSADPRLFLVVGAVPFAVLAWTAIDNATFLFSPVRTGAAHDGALQNAGRAMVLMLVRSTVLAVCAALAALPYGVFYALELPDVVAIGGGVLAGATILCLEISVLVFLGGLVLRRFDAPRDLP
ncbi:MAG: hypothetical protein FJ298_02185 [Planctomycetes bacterium]|nr:hypothetical protein [Planctomycetota bacterium]